MAKSKLDKLKDAILEARTFADGVVVGNAAGQYEQADVDELDSLIESVELVAQDESLEPSRYDAALTSLDEGFKYFQSKVIQESAPLAVTSNYKVVSLKGGSVSQCKGPHTLHYKHTIVSFVDGKAELPESFADELIEAGYAE
jgi:hypothetical protein